MKLRDATFEDWKVLLDLRNDEGTKQNSFNQEDINENDHKNWLANSLENGNRRIRILYDSKTSTSVGMIREDHHLLNNESKYPSVTLSWAIHPEYRGKGLGTKILKLATEDRSESFYAEIKHENIASIKMTTNNGFKEMVNLEEDTYKTFKKRGPLEIISAIEHVRTANNVNWMDLCRLAFRYAPKEARAIMRRVNSHDNQISDLLKELSDE